MMKWITPEIAIVGAGMIAMALLGFIILVVQLIGPPEEEKQDTSDTGLAYHHGEQVSPVRSIL
jgi:hypothetical protein